MDYTITFAFRYRGKTPRIIALKQKPRPTSYSSTLMSKLHLAALCLRATQNISKWVLLVRCSLPCLGWESHFVSTWHQLEEGPLAACKEQSRVWCLHVFVPGIQGSCGIWTCGGFCDHCAATWELPELATDNSAACEHHLGTEFLLKDMTWDAHLSTHCSSMC